MELTVREDLLARESFARHTGDPEHFLANRIVRRIADQRGSACSEDAESVPPEWTVPIAIELTAPGTDCDRYGRRLTLTRGGYPHVARCYGAYKSSTEVDCGNGNIVGAPEYVASGQDSVG